MRNKISLSSLSLSLNVGEIACAEANKNKDYLIAMSCQKLQYMRALFVCSINKQEMLLNIPIIPMKYINE